MTLDALLVGYGLAGRAFHAPFIATTPGLRLAGVVVRDPGRRAQAQADHPGVRLLDEPVLDGFDLVVVAAPNAVHVPLATAAIDAGVAVVVDKPLAPDAASARELVARARARGVMLTVFHNRRWDGDFLTLRRLLAAGALGEVVRFESRFERWRPEVGDGWRESGAGGGVLLDLGPHLVDQALHLFGPVIEVYGEVDVRRPGARMDDDAFVALTHASGVRSHLWMSLAAPDAGPRLRVLGTRAAYVKRGLDVQEAALRAGERPGPEPESAWGTLAGVPVRTETGDYGAFYEGVVAALAGGASPPVDPSDAVAGLQILEEVRRRSTAATPAGPIATSVHHHDTPS